VTSNTHTSPFGATTRHQDSDAPVILRDDCKQSITKKGMDESVHKQKPQDFNEAAQPADMDRTPLPSDHGGKVLHQSTELALRAIKEQGDQLRPDKYSERRCLPHLRG
jgi:hypothetical protein